MAALMLLLLCWRISAAAMAQGDTHAGTCATSTVCRRPADAVIWPAFGKGEECTELAGYLLLCMAEKGSRDVCEVEAEEHHECLAAYAASSWSRTNRLVTYKHGRLLLSPYDLHLVVAVELYGEWLEEELQLSMAFLPHAGVVVEAGTNAGVHLVPMAKKVGANGRVVGIEPGTGNNALATANAALNTLHNVEVLRGQLGGGEGWGDYIMRSSWITGEEHAVTQIALDDLVSNLDLDVLSLLKLHCDGQEDEVILGGQSAISTLWPVVYLQLDSPHHRCGGGLHFLTSLGYECWVHTFSWYSPNNHHVNTVNYFGASTRSMLLCVPHQWLARDNFPHDMVAKMARFTCTQ